MVRFISFRNKVKIMKTAWQKRGFEYEGQKVFLDHDHDPEALRKRKEYIEAKKLLRVKYASKHHFQRGYGCSLREKLVFTIRLKRRLRTKQGGAFR